MKCKNCKTELNTVTGYCNRCGAKVIRNRLTLKKLFASFSEQFLDYDNKFLQTFINLFKRPEDVIGSYINGTRKKYVNVISYYAIAITLAGLHTYILNKFFPEVMDMSVLAVDETGVELQQWIMENSIEYQSIIMMLNVPIYALISRLVFLKNKKFNYTEHLVIFMYILAQVSIVTVFLTIFIGLMGISIGVISLILLPFQILYSAYCLKRLYGLSLRGIILKTLLLIAILLALFIMFMIITLILALVKPELFEGMIEAQKKASSGD